MLRVLGDDTRRLILERLAQGPQPVSSSPVTCRSADPAVSQHLKVLKEAHLVSDRAIGTRRVYHLDQAGLTLLRSYLDVLWSRALDGFAAAASEPPDPTNAPGPPGEPAP